MQIDQLNSHVEELNRARGGENFRLYQKLYEHDSIIAASIQSMVQSLHSMCIKKEFYFIIHTFFGISELSTETVHSSVCVGA